METSDADAPFTLADASVDGRGLQAGFRDLTWGLLRGLAYELPAESVD